MSSSSCHVSFAFQSGSTTYAASRTQAPGGGGEREMAFVPFHCPTPPALNSRVESLLLSGLPTTRHFGKEVRSRIRMIFSFWICCHSPSMRTDRGVTFSCDRERQSLPHRFNTAIFKHKSASPLLCGAFTVSSTVQFLIQDMIM